MMILIATKTYEKERIAGRPYLDRTQYSHEFETAPEP
jgi:hypothetical protein